METTKLRVSIAAAEKALAAVEKNGVEYFYTHEGNFPCGGCRTYEKAVREALAILRSIDVELSPARAGDKV